MWRIRNVVHPIMTADVTIVNICVCEDMEVEIYDPEQTFYERMTNHFLDCSFGFDLSKLKIDKLNVGLYTLRGAYIKDYDYNIWAETEDKWTLTIAYDSFEKNVPNTRFDDYLFIINENTSYFIVEKPIFPLRVETVEIIIKEERKIPRTPRKGKKGVEKYLGIIRPHSTFKEGGKSSKDPLRGNKNGIQFGYNQHAGVSITQSRIVESGIAAGFRTLDDQRGLGISQSQYSAHTFGHSDNTEYNKRRQNQLLGIFTDYTKKGT